MPPRDAFPGYDDPVNIDGEFEDVVTQLMSPATEAPEEDEVEPELDD